MDTTKALFIKLKDCNGVVVTARLGVKDDGSGQSNVSNSVRLAPRGLNR
jgi:hypothetical protein